MRWQNCRSAWWSLGLRITEGDIRCLECLTFWRSLFTVTHFVVSAYSLCFDPREDITIEKIPFHCLLSTLKLKTQTTLWVSTLWIRSIMNFRIWLRLETTSSRHAKKKASQAPKVFHHTTLLVHAVLCLYSWCYQPSLSEAWPTFWCREMRTKNLKNMYVSQLNCAFIVVN